MKITPKIATIMLLSVSILWGFGFVFTQIALDAGFTTLQFLTLRFFVGAVSLTVIFRKSLEKPSKNDLISGFVVGFLLSIAFFFQTFGQSFATPSITAFITTIYVVFVPLFESLFFKSKVDIYGKIGSILTLIGIGFITLDSFGKGDLSFGIILILICAILYAFQIISVDKFTNGKMHISPLSITIYMLWFAFILTGIIATITTISNPNVISKENLFVGLSAITFLGIFSTAICFLFQNIAQTHVSPTKASILLSLESVFGALFSGIILKETFTYKIIIGFFIVFIAILICELKPKIMIKNKLTIKEEI